MERKHSPFDFDLVFDPTEIGGTGVWSYFGLMTDMQTIADILIRIPSRGDNREEMAHQNAREVVRRWNNYYKLVEALKDMLAVFAVDGPNSLQIAARQLANEALAEAEADHE